VVQPTLQSALSGGEKAKAGKARVALQGFEKNSRKDAKGFAQILSRAKGKSEKGFPEGKRISLRETSAPEGNPKTARFDSEGETGNLKKSAGKKSAESAAGAAGEKEKMSRRKIPGEALLAEAGKTSSPEAGISPTPSGAAKNEEIKTSPLREGLGALRLDKTAPPEKPPADIFAGRIPLGTRAEAVKAEFREAGNPEPMEGRKKIDGRTAALRAGKEKVKEPADKPAENRPFKGEQDITAGEDQKKEALKETLEIRVTSRNGNDRFSENSRVSDGRDQREAADGLLRQFREEGNARIVRSARVILKDGNEGEIRLILKPERLGEVRIRLHLQDNLIAGRVFVENSSVREAFENNMGNLAEAFEQSGFEFAGLDVSVSGGGEDKNENEPPRFIREMRASELEKSVTRADPGLYYASHAVNMMA
jgi:hypothetical protein